MTDKKLLGEKYKLNPPATEALIEAAQRNIKIALPIGYKNLLMISNGLYSLGNLALHEIQDLPDRNIEYEVSDYLSGYFMIGDDSGGVAILINETGEIFEVEMGVMNESFIEKSANSIDELLVFYKGKTLSER